MASDCWPGGASLSICAATENTDAAVTFWSRIDIAIDRRAYTVAVVKNFYRLKNPAHKTLSNAGPNTTGPQLMIDSGSPKEAKNMGKLIASTMRLIASTNSKKTVQITSNITFIILFLPPVFY